MSQPVIPSFLSNTKRPREVDMALDSDTEAKSSSEDTMDLSVERPPQHLQRSITFDDSMRDGSAVSNKSASGLGRIRTAVTRQNSKDNYRSGTATPVVMQHGNVSSTHLEDLEAFPTTSLHSFSFAVQHDTIAARHNIVQRSIDYLRERLTGGTRSVSFQEVEHRQQNGEDPSKAKAAKFGLRINLDGVNENAFDPSKRPPRTAPLDHAVEFEEMALEQMSTMSTSQRSSGRTSPNSTSRSTTTTSGTSNHSYTLQVPRGRAMSFSDKYPDMRKQLQSSLSCTNLPNLNPSYQTSPLQPLHATNRWGQQTTQAVFTTSLEEPWHILTANDYAMMIFGLSRDAIRQKSLVDYIVEDRREWLRNRLQISGKQNLADGQVLLCGDVLPVIKRLGTGAASLWIKEKRNGLVWVIEEIEEGVCTLSLDAKDDRIAAAHGEAAKVFDREVTDQALSALLPTLPRLPTGLLDLAQIDKISNFTLKSAAGDVPCTVNTSIFSTENKHSIRVSFLPHVAGIVVLDAESLTVKSANSVFTSSLFGFKETSGCHISQLIPEFEELIRYLMEENDGDFTDGQVVPELAFRDAVKRLDNATAESTLRGLKSCHRDGSTIHVDIQMRVSCGSQSSAAPDDNTKKFSIGPSGMMTDRLYALWISYEKGLTPKAQDQVVHNAVSKAKNVVAPSNTSTAPPSPEEPVDVDSQLADSVTEIVPRDIKDYQIVEEMGAGAYGQVKLARYGRKRQRVVLKYVTKSRILVDTWTRDRKLGTVPLEIHVLNHLKNHRHRNVVEMKDFFEDDQNYYVVMSAHIPGMDLFDYIELNTSMSEWECKCISLQAAKAIEHLHSLDIVHRDIKDENVVLDRSGWVKLIDFGSANYCRNGPFDTFHGTLDYASPEALDGKPYMGKEQDVWACGILFYTLIYKENPFYNIDEIMDRDLRVPYVISEKSIDLVRKMLNRDVAARLTMEEVRNHGWFADCVGDPQEKVKIDIPQR